MPKFTWSRWRVLGPALVAGFSAIMCAGPGLLAVPAAARLAGPFVCPAGAEIRYSRVRHSYQRPGELSSVQVNCAEPNGGHSGDVFGQVFLTLSGIYFVLLFVPLLLWCVTASGAATPPEQLPPLEGGAEQEVRALLAAGRRVEAIRRVREITGAGLEQAEGRVDSLPKPAPAGAAGGQEAAARRPQEDPVVRLAQLKEMLDRGLISEQEYQVKRDDILSGL